ncbi:Crp/Fnr family transcriptional regulator [Nocardiopsis gilva YIM 90087]|uniref:Crp/Fnr family transcriptional regulator n=1 Tax=Nocardiopsis gilva YIM 90087 TaxID=1235441 RepID=A0A223SAK4_9ACTN|nr:Crp/Fnr family transcriptional regulator [Nocardiopsis gilva]ASU85158.1 Crp/Fnr family transcriptional regulator [Nocardiopsis gilva YIM 90087]
MTRHGFGARLTDETWGRLIQAGRPQRYEPGSPIMNQGDPGGSVHLLLEGAVKVAMVRPDGSLVALAFRGPGEILGEFSAWSGAKRAATVLAVGPCQTRVFPTDRFRALAREWGLEDAVWGNILARQCESDELRAEQSALPAGRRLAAALLRLARTLGEPIDPEVSDGAVPRRRGVLLAISLSQRDIADYIGLSRTSVALEYTRLKELGAIRTGRKYVAIHDLDLLESLAEAGESEVI